MKKVRPIENVADLLKEKEMIMRNLIVSDPLGSYTGRPLEKWEVPVQDADDL